MAQKNAVAPAAPTGPTTAPIRYTLLGAFSAAAIGRWLLGALVATKTPQCPTGTYPNARPTPVSVHVAQATIALLAKQPAGQVQHVVSLGMLRTIAKRATAGMLRVTGVPKLTSAQVATVNAAIKSVTKASK